jgi:LPS-assembly protein
MGGRASPSCRGIASWLVRSLLGVLVMASAAIPAAAQFTFGGGAHEDKNAPILFRADEIQFDEQLALTIARGHVEISQNGMVLLADTVTYNQRTDTVTASGNVSLTQPTGEIVFADFMELRDSMSEGLRRT